MNLGGKPYPTKMDLAEQKDALGNPLGAKDCPAGTSVTFEGLISGCAQRYACHERNMTLDFPLNQSSFACTVQRSTTCGDVDDCSIVFCYACIPGKYREETSTLLKCVPCVLGRTCVGQGNKAGDAPCPSGFYCPRPSISIPVNDGFVAKSDANGIGVATGATLIEPCAAGKFKNDSAATECTGCAAGEFSLAGAASCTSCRAGTYQNEKDRASCPVCIDGQYSSVGSTSCKDCEKGKHGVAAHDKCVACAAGKWSSATAQTTSSVCTPCGAGTYSYAQGASEPAQCNACPPGRYNDKIAQTSADEGCHTCAAGKANPLSGQSEPSKCADCVAGRHQAEMGKATCIACAAGKYGDATEQLAESTCKACGAGNYNAAAGASEVAQCTACPVGKYGGTLAVPATSDACIACAAGKANPLSGQSGPSKCTNCVAGRHQAEMGKATCIACAAGKHGDATEQLAESACKPCGAGKYSSAVGASEAAQCTDCPGGRFGTHVMAIVVGACTPCVTGRSNSLSGQVAEAACVVCVKGRYQNKPGQVNCIPTSCPPGKFGVREPGCFSCPIGTYGAFRGLGDVTQCTRCPIGRWSDTPNATEASACEFCPAGRFGNITGLRSVLCSGYCDAGEFSQRGAVECTPCQQGEVSRTVGSGRCEPCPKTQTSKAHSSKCICEAEYYDSSNSSGPTSCRRCSAESMNCSEVGTVLTSLKVKGGFWRTDLASSEFLACPVKEACTPNGTVGDANNTTTGRFSSSDIYCATGHTGPFCGVCRPNYFRRSNIALCSKCDENSTGSIVLAFGALIVTGLLVWLFLFLSRHTSSGAMRTVINASQTLSLILMTTTEWPDSIKQVQTTILQAVNFDFVTLASPTCAGIPMDYFTRFAALVVGVIMLIGTPWVLSFVYFHLVHKDAAHWIVSKQRRLKDTVTLLLLAYTTITIQAFKYFRCQRITNSAGDSTHYLMADFGVKCYEGNYWPRAICVILVLAVLSFGMPVANAVLLWRLRKQLDDDDIQQLFGTLYMMYRKDTRVVAESLTFGFRLLYLLALASFPPNSQYQSGLMMLICVAQIGVHIKMQPFSDSVDNALQYCGLALSFVPAFMGLLLSYAKVHAEYQSLRLVGAAKYEAEKEAIADRIVLDTITTFAMATVIAAYVAVVGFYYKDKLLAFVRCDVLRRRCCARHTGEVREQEQEQDDAIHPPSMMGSPMPQQHAQQGQQRSRVHIEMVEAKHENRLMPANRAISYQSADGTSFLTENPMRGQSRDGVSHKQHAARGLDRGEGGTAMH